MKKKITFFAFSIAVLFSCKVKEIFPDQGSIYMTVSDQSGKSVSGANITSNPAIAEYKTDNLGSVLLRNLNVGVYEFIANKPLYGSGKAIATVTTNEITNVHINLQYGVFESYSPTVKISSPTSANNFYAGEEILFTANVSDKETLAQNLTVRWESSIDGVINEGKADINGISTFKTSKLSPNDHIIRLSVKDESGNIGRDSISISTLSPKEINLQPLTKSEGNVQLNWTKSTETNFKEYRIYRANQNCDETSITLIGTIQDVATTTFQDKKAPFSTKACYFVEVVNTLLKSRRSNKQQIDYPGGAILLYTPKDVVIHPTKPWVYLSRTDKGIVTVYDYENSKIITEISAPSLSGFLLVANNGNGINLYVPATNSTLYIYDASTFELKQTLQTLSPATDVAVNGNGVVFATVNNQWTNPIGSYIEKTGIALGGQLNYSCIYGGARLRKIPGQNTLMSISTQISPTDMVLLYYDAQGKLTTCKSDTQHGAYPLDASIFSMSPLGNYVLTASNGSAYLTDETMKYLGVIKNGGTVTYSDFAFNSDGSIFYGGTSNRQSIQIGKYPELARTGELLCKGYPYKIFVKGNSIISVSKTELNSPNIAVEIIPIP